MYFVNALITFVLAVFFWREASAPFIRANNESSDLSYADAYLAIAMDFVKAITIGINYSRKIPVGVYFHGLFLIATVALLFVGWSLE